MKNLPRSLIAVAAVFLFSATTSSATAPTEFLKKVPISLSASAQTALGNETLSGFPVLVRLSSAISGFDYADIAANHADIAFGSDDGSVITPYPFEVAEWDPNGTSLVWVRVPSLSAATSFNFYYGNGASVANTPSDTWAGYAGVWHMDETYDATTAPTGLAHDSTANGLDATPTNGGSGNLVQMTSAAGVVGNARVNATSNTTKGNYLSVPNYDSLALGNTFAISGWFKATTVNGYPRLWSRKNAYTDPDGWEIENANGVATKFSARGASSTSITLNTPTYQNAWLHIALVYNGTTLTTYANGEPSGSGTIAAATENGKPLSFGNNSNGSERSFPGLYDEIRLLDATPSAAWFAVEYAVAADPASLVYGAAEMLDATAPIFAGAPTVVGSNGSFTFTATLASGAGDLYMVLTDLATGIATTNLVAANASSPGDYTAAPTLVSGRTYSYAVLGVNALGTAILTPGVGPVYAGEVTIAQTTDADEASMAAGAFTVSRGTATLGDLVVSYTIGGTAVADETYEALSGTVVIPAGATSATIAVTPIYSAAVQSDVTVIATLAAGAYLAGSPDSATVTVVNSSVNPYVRYVSTTGSDANDGYVLATAKATLQAAIDSLDAVSAENDCTVYVAPGTYAQPKNSSYCVYVTNRVAVVGMTGDPADVIINRASDATGIFRMDNPNAALRAVTVTGGQLGSSNSSGIQKGAGVYLSSGAVEDCIVSNCTGRAYGQTGIGIQAEGGRVSRCRLARNVCNNDVCSGVGVYASGSALVEDCLVDHNNCKQGGAVYLAGSATFLNGTIVKNTGSNYSGVRVGSNTARVVNCAIFDNTVDQTLEGAVYSAGYGARYDHCAADMEIEGGVDCLFTQSVFRDVTNGDFRPAAGSPLLDAGAARSGYGAVSTTDFDGLSRANGTVDIGCFESAKDAAECGFTWSASQYVLPAQVTLHADSLNIDSPSYAWTFHNETTGTDVTMTGKDAVWNLAAADAGSYTLTLTVGGTSYTSPEKLTVSQPVLYASAGNASAAFPYATEQTAAPDIASAVAAAGEGATIYVLPGEFKISSQIKVSKDLRILGTGEKYTYVVITNTVSGNEKRVFALQHPDVLVANLTMAGGRAGGGNEGGNLFIYGKGGTVSNCLLTAGIVNASYQQGGGAASLRAGTITHCEITRCNAIPAKNNPAPRVLFTMPTSAAMPIRISNCFIHDCDATEGTNATRGKGALLNLGTRTTVENCTIADCTVVAGAEAAYLNVLQGKYNESARLINCAVFVRDGNGDVAPISGGVAWGTFWPYCVYNCAAESEIGATITAQNGGGNYYSATDCIVTNAAACFQDPVRGNYRPKADGPLVNAGLDYEPVAGFDFLGKTRVVGNHIDIGAYEVQPSGTVILLL